MKPEQQVKDELSSLSEAVEFVLKRAKEKGADQCEVSVSRQTGVSISTRDQQVETLEFNRDGAMGIALYKDSCKGSVSTSDLSQSAIEQALDAALDISRYTSQDPDAGIGDADLMAKEVRDLDLFHPQDLKPARFIELACELEAKATSYSGIKASDGASLNSHYGAKVYGNSHGFIGGYPTSRHSMSCMLIAGEEEMQRDYAYSVARDFNDLQSIASIADEAAQKTLSRLNSRKIDTCVVPVVFDREVASGLFGHFVGAISGSNLYRRSSFLLDSMGQSIFPDWLSISEDPFVLKGLGSTPFDSEGIRTQKQNIVTSGELQSYLLTTYSARKLGMKSTGHAGGIHNWYVHGMSETRQALLDKMGTGLLVTELMGQGVNIVTGDYSRGAAGFWVENGKIMYPVHEITIAGNLKEMYKNIVAIADDPDPCSSIQSGSVLIESMKIAGS
ncbi:metalloprotease PmbA [Alginatibacterium sediminis]|uniref:Metalloprotease PmbA n=1 Tax=Alginatibacterium sediminis TaxID=2164068 RepID=A0A420EKY5_9ALTE|nr:metalloprotease PmbA [Alginatibacterium sediminis]RKF21357.1 metalloprotease PmbA [Alginatibacterium sediminis]